MDFTLSWDLCVIVFFGIVISYSFIIGLEESVKVIVFTYVAMVAAQGAGSLLAQVSQYSQPLLTSFGLGFDATMLDVSKLILFIILIVLLAIRGGFAMESETGNSAISTALTGILGFATGGLLLTALLTFMTGMPLTGAHAAAPASLATLMQQSELLRNMVVYRDAWLSAPALLLIIVGLMAKE